MEISKLFRSILVAVSGGMVIAMVMHKKEEPEAKPSILNKVKELDRKLYIDGENQAKMIKAIKQDVEQAVRE